ncbi:hypothetical protein [Vibrio bathopelagicus]
MNINSVVKDCRPKFINLIKDLADEYQLSTSDMLLVLQASIEDYKAYPDFPNYERHRVSGVIRNKNTRRILRPNARGQVRLRHGSISKWVMQSKEACYE